MKIIRLLLISLSVVLVLATLLVAAAFNPVVQTWLVQRALARYPGLHASVGSVSAGVSFVHLSDVRLQLDGAVLTLPALKANLPIKTALWDRKIVVQTLVAKGWTLDLSRRPATPSGETARDSIVASPKDGPTPPEPVPAAPASTHEAARGHRGLLRGLVFPKDTSLDGVELEGDVLIATPSSNEPTRVHVTLKGGGLASGRNADFAFDAVGNVADSGQAPNILAAHGRLRVAIGSARTVHRLEFNGKLSAIGAALPADLSVAAVVAAADGAGEESYTVDFSRGSRHLATVTAGSRKDGRQIDGTWKIDLRDSDLVDFHPSRSFPILAAAGDGIFDTDTTFAQLHATGRLTAPVSRPGMLAPTWDRLGTVQIEAGFDVTLRRRSIRFERVNVTLVGARPIAVAHAIQPFSVDEKTGNLTLTDPGADWLEGSLQGLPLAWLSGVAEGLAFAGGDATGDFAVNTASGKFALRSKAPFVATGVSVQRAGQTIGQGLDLTLALIAEHTPHGWQVQGAPLTIASAGRPLATIEAKVSPPTETGRRYAIAGSWNADIDALASQPAIPGISLFNARSASGDFSANIGAATDVKSRISVVGHDPTHVVSANINAYFDAIGGVSFQAPVTIAFGTNTSEFSANGSWAKGKSGPRLDVDLNGVNVALEHVTLLAAPLATAGGISLPAILAAWSDGPRRSAAVRDQRPFWSDWSGRVKFACYRLRMEAHDLHQVAGTFEIAAGAIRLTGGRGAFSPVVPPPPPPTPKAKPVQSRLPTKKDPPSSVVTMEGSISYDEAAEAPYGIKAAVTVDVIDAARLFTVAQAEHEPVIEGRFSLAGTVTSDGRNLADLVARRREEFRLASKNGIIRLLKINVAESIPDAPTPVTDALANVGSALGFLLGIKEGSLSNGKSRLSKETEAVLNFSYLAPEIRYDQLTFTALREADGPIRLSEIAMSGPNARLIGSGQITSVKGLPLRAQPLSLELRFGARGNIAPLLSTAGLLSSEKDEQGYTMMPQTIPFGGTLEQIDNRPWRDVLVKAALQKPERGKKGG
ncbi:MAG: hypothetical protein EXS37_15570 [Opitutus sp.]|nr:hypothetical protein [Opitutus sp.]